jgi:RNA polymerase sigma factor (TIGR02999 family)
MSEVTEILNAINRGDSLSVDRLLPLVYDELRRLAAAKLAHEAAGQTLTPTVLVHEMYLRLAPNNPGWENRGHFFAAAAEAMRRILVDRARARKAAKRGGGAQRVEVELEHIAAPVTDDELIDLDSVLDALSEQDSGAANVVRLHIFTGLSINEAATALGVSRATAYRDWTFARAWLRDRLKSE